MSWLTLTGLLPLFFWALLALDRSRAWPAELRLPAAVPGEAGPPAGVVAIVPARDEATVLGATLPALLAEARRVVLVDDGSSDGTAAAARALAAAGRRSERLSIVEAAPPPPGWTGKVHALASGVEAVERTAAGGADWLLFVDADIRLRPGTVAALLEVAKGGVDGASYDLVSVMARLRAKSSWERLLIPPFVFFFQLLYPFRRVRRRDARVVAAAGGLALVRRRALEDAGGLAALRGAVIDDVALARCIAAAGGRVWLGLDGEVESVRAYEGLAGIWRMVARSAYVQLRLRPDLLALTLAGLALLVVAPPFVLAAAAGRLAGGGAAHEALPALAASLAAWALEARMLSPAVRHHRAPIAWSATLPFAAIFYGLMTAHSAWLHHLGRGAGWKGRSPTLEPCAGRRRGGSPRR